MKKKILLMLFTCMLSLTACGKTTVSEKTVTDGVVSDTLDVGENVSDETGQN